MAKKNKTKIKAEPGKQEIDLTREFDAPRELVFQAIADPKHIPNQTVSDDVALAADR